MRQSQKKEIDGIMYEFTALPAKKSLRLLVGILKIIGAPIGEAAGALPAGKIDLANIVKKGKDSLLDTPMDIGRIINLLCENITEEKVEGLILLALSGVVHYGNAETKGLGEVEKSFDVIFAGDIGHMLNVTKEALLFEYSGFFGGGAILNLMGKK